MKNNPILHGYALAFITIVIWSGWMISSRMGMLSSLTAFDIVFLRYVSSALIMLPITFKSFHLITRENRRAIFIMTLGAGAPYLFLCNLGFASAPASHGILTPSTMPLWVGIASIFLLGEKFSYARTTGYFLILIGAVFKIGFGENGFVGTDLFFIAAAICWAIYTIQNKMLNGLSPIVVAAFVACANAAYIIIPYTIYQIYEPRALPIDMSLQIVIVQGFLTGVVSLITYNKAIQLIGAAQTSSFAALAPVMVTVLAIPFLGEIPTTNDWIFVAFMTSGVFLASGVIRFRRAI